MDVDEHNTKPVMQMQYFEQKEFWVSLFNLFVRHTEESSPSLNYHFFN